LSLGPSAERVDPDQRGARQAEIARCGVGCPSPLLLVGLSQFRGEQRVLLEFYQILAISTNHPFS
jgi:hypothetical protein